MPLVFSTGPADLAVELELKTGSLTGLYGPSGSGKTTLLRILAGLTTPTDGFIRHQDQLWLDTTHQVVLPVQQRPVGMVFQDAALFPNMTVRENVQFATGKRRDGLVDELLELVNLGALANRKPDSLSGGQRQRVALIRALARRPQVLLLDEPFSALDEETREQLLTELIRLHRQFGTTTILVSHQREELSRVADRLIKVENGRIRERETGESLNTALVPVRFTGTIVRIEDQRAIVRLPEGGVMQIQLPLAASWKPGSSVTVVVSEPADQ